MLSPETILGRWGYVGIIVFLILTGCGLPIPEEVPIVGAGWASSPEQGKLDPWLALLSCYVGAVVGDIIMYGIGRRFGRRLLQKRAWFASMLTPEKEQQIEDMFRHHGLKVLFVSRFLVGVRSPIYVTAGILKVPFRRFVLVDMFCAGVMVTAFFALAYFFSNHVLKWIRQAEWAVTIIIAVLAIVALVGYRSYRKRKAAERLEAEQKAASSDNAETEVERSVA
jgi:membrane protein DedA with SNARE-associated domain